MKVARWTRRLFDSTRGQIILLLRQESRTVADLAGALGLTDNAVRAHLVTLERDGLVHQSGERVGFRKPHFSYELTSEAGDLFPKAYGPILNQLVAVLKESIGPEKTEALLREVGRRVAPPRAKDDEVVFEKRLEQALRSLDNLGGQASIAREEGRVIIRGTGCPLSAASADHGEVCKMVETCLSEIIGTPVHQTCQREPSPHCSFEVQVPKGRIKSA